MLTAENIYKSFGALKVLEGVSLTVPDAQVVTLIGPSGSGKSTLLRCMNQLETVDRGRIALDNDVMCETVDGKARYADKKTLRRISTRMGMVFQSFNLFPHMSVLQNLIDAPVHVLGVTKDEAVERAKLMLDRVGLIDRVNQYPYQLSGGQQQRVAIARALCMQPEVMCFDEPTSALDPLLTKEVLAVMKGLAAEKTTMLIVTHEMAFARDVSDEIVFMQGGHVVESGSPEQLFSSENPDTKKFLGTN